MKGFGGRYGHMSSLGLKPEGREHPKTSPSLVLYKEAKFLIQRGKITDALDVLCELEVYSPKRANELLKLIC